MSDTIVAVNLPLYSPSVQKLPTYVLAALILMPHQPGFLIPTTAPSTFAVSWHDVTSAAESGIEVLSKAKLALPTAAHGSRVDG